MSKKTTKITPRRDQVLVKPDEDDSHVSDHGIIKPDNVEEETKAFGEVVSTGPEVKDLKKGDRVVYGKFAGEQLSVKEKGEEVEYVLLQDEWVLAFLS